MFDTRIGGGKLNFRSVEPAGLQRGTAKNHMGSRAEGLSSESPVSA
jgi:hypothetical protein